MTDRLTLTLDLSELPREFETTPSEAVTALVEFAVGVGASDLFFLSEEDAVAIAVRHMGIVRQLRTYGSEFGTRMLTNVKVLAGMDISDRMKPSEGRWISEAETRGPVDVRATMHKAA